MKQVYLFFLLVLTTTSNAQDIARQKYHAMYKALKLGIAPPMANKSVIQLDIEKRMDKYGLQVAVGLCPPFQYRIDDTIKGTGYGYSIRLEGRKYKKLASHPAGSPYMAAELFYSHYSLPAHGYFEDTAGVNEYLDYYLMRKQMFGIAGKFGLQVRFLRHFLFDMNAGLGLQLINASQRGRTNENDRYAAVDLTVGGVESRLGTRVAATFPFHVCIGYYFK